MDHSTGTLVGSTLYGIVIVLFFQCIAALFDPVHRRGEGIKWGLVFYTMATFSFVTVFTLLGPIGYQSFKLSGVLVVIPNLMFLLNYWLADGLLLYRCYVIYSMRRWVIAFPCFMYLGSVVMGVMTLIFQASPSGFWVSIPPGFGLPYLLISVSLNTLLTLMIVTRLLLYTGNIRAAMGASGGISGWYKTIITMLIESSMLYAVTSLLVIVPLVARSRAVDIILPILAETQVIAPLLIVRRVANESALTSRTVVTGHSASTFNFGSRGNSAADSAAFPDGYPMSLADTRGKTSDEHGVRVETIINFHRDQV